MSLLGFGLLNAAIDNIIHQFSPAALFIFIFYNIGRLAKNISDYGWW
jgi:uncharacterized membrane protein YiaA